jgi:rSAM/selenodomain-associated transferase 1
VELDLEVNAAICGLMRRAILVFLKYPEPGRVKTRLAATVGPNRAAEIYRQLVSEVFARVSGDAEVFACFDPVERRAECEEWLAGRAAHFLPQATGDLGMRLVEAFAEAFARGFSDVAAIGTDCPEIDASLFTQAWNALETHEVVLGPSGDGGYYLVALRESAPPLFSGIAWSSAQVLSQTLDRAAAANLRVHLLPKRHDVDTEEDWRQVRPRLLRSTRADLPT